MARSSTLYLTFLTINTRRRVAYKLWRFCLCISHFCATSFLQHQLLNNVATMAGWKLGCTRCHSCAVTQMCYTLIPTSFILSGVAISLPDFPQANAGTVFMFYVSFSITNITSFSLGFRFGFRGWVAPKADNYPTFRRTQELPSARWICNGWAFLDPQPCAQSLWTAASYSAPPISCMKCISHLLLALYKAAQKWPTTIHIHPEDDICNVCRNTGKFSTFDAVHPRHRNL
jgi:hypothetical protein